MLPVRSLTLVALGLLTAIGLGGSGCSAGAPSHREGPAGSTQAGLALTTPGFVETTVFQGLTKPTVVRFASDGRVFVAQKDGKLLVFDSLTDTTPTGVLNLADQVHDFWDRGLLGMTLDPDFPTKPFVYVMYAYDGDPGGTSPKWTDTCPAPPGATDDGCVVSGRLSRFTLTGNSAGSETVLLEGWRQQYPSHSTGQVEFGPDGALYASSGDGASFNFVDFGQDGSPLNPLGDPPVAVGQAQTPPSAEGGALRSQSLRRAAGPTLLNGSVIRIDPTTGLGLSTNPLGSSSDAIAKRIIAYGLRNPFRIAARPGKNEVWIADVGWNDWEELNRIPLGGNQPLNFGWPCYEGAGKQAAYDATDLSLCESLYTAGSATAPFFAYKHSAGVSANDQCGRGSSSVSGIAFYSGSSYPAGYQGGMFFADYSRRCIYSMQAGQNGDPDPATARSFHADADGPVFITPGPDGDLFYVAFNSGKIQRISYLQPVAAFSATPTAGQVPLIVNFDGSSSTPAQPGDVLSYAWDLDGDGDYDDSDDVEPAYLYDTIGNYAARLKVTDQRGTTSVSQPLTIKALKEPPPKTTPPQVFIDTPSQALRWKAGQTIAFTGHATDAEDGPLPASALSWQVVIQHCPDGCHIHDLLSFDGVASGSFTAEDHEYPMHLELILTATDSSGEKRTARLPLEPLTVSLTFDSQPSGLALTVGSTSQTTPFARRVIVGSENSVAAPVTQAPSGTPWTFAQWSDGQPRVHSIKATTAKRYLATYATGGGLTGQYFDQLAFTGLSLTRVDPTVDFDWGTGAPDPRLSADSFSVRWTGEIKADFAETYSFTTLSDDGIRVSIDGASVINHFNDHAPATDIGSLALSVGWHPIVIEYYEATGGAQAHLSWTSASQPSQIVPESHLRPGCNGVACSGGLSCNANQQCVPACQAGSCSSSQHCSVTDGSCVPLCSGVTCPTGDKCVSGSCLDACYKVTCPSGQHCAGGSCVSDPSGGEGGAGGEGGEPSGSGGTASGGGAAGSGGSSGSSGSAGTSNTAGNSSAGTASGGASGGTDAGGSSSGGTATGNGGSGNGGTDNGGAGNGSSAATGGGATGGNASSAGSESGGNASSAGSESGGNASSAGSESGGSSTAGTASGGSGGSGDSLPAAGAPTLPGEAGSPTQPGQGGDTMSDGGLTSGAGAEPGEMTDGGANEGGRADTGGGGAHHDSGCSCRTAGGERSGSAWPLLGLVALVGLRRRR